MKISEIVFLNQINCNFQCFIRVHIHIKSIFRLWVTQSYIYYIFMFFFFYESIVWKQFKNCFPKRLLVELKIKLVRIAIILYNMNDLNFSANKWLPRNFSIVFILLSSEAKSVFGEF